MSAFHPKTVFVTGGTGYIGNRLIGCLLERGHTVRALVRAGSEKKLPAGAIPLVGNALDAATFGALIAPADAFVQLVGTPHPSPAKAEEFRRVDLASIRASLKAAQQANVSHFIYVSVGQPAPIMKAYQSVRAEGETLIRSAGFPATILRPWYVLGPGHWWPALLLPLYGLAARWPSTRESARRLGLVSVRQMVAALVHAVENPPSGWRLWEVPQIREVGRAAEKSRINH